MVDTDASAPSREPHRFIFVGGVHRSGTTLIADLLAQHPEISGLADTGVPENEGQHLQAVFPIALELGGFGRFAFSDRAHLTESSPLVSPATRKRLLDSWSPFWEVSKPVLLEKSPPNVLKTRFLQALFPGSRFLMVLRHPLAVSYATHRMLAPRRRLDLHTHIEHWLLCYETLLQDSRYLDHLTLIRYEDFLEDPAGQLAALDEALGMAGHGVGTPIRPGLNESYFRRWSAGGWNPLKRAYRKYLVERFEAQINRFGYSLQNLEASQPDPAVAALRAPDRK